MNEIVLGGSAGQVTHGAQPQPGPHRPTESGARSTQGGQWSGKVLTWSDLPPETQQEAWTGQDVIAEHVTKLTATALRIAGAPHQRLVGWRAHPDRVVVATAVRPLGSRPDGRMAPVGPWAHHEVAHLVAPTAPRRREGLVSPGTGGAGSTWSGGDAATGPRVARDHLEAANTTAYLPAPVRQGLVDAVPVPVRWSGEIVRFSEDDYPVRHRIVLLRADERRAVVVVADRRLPPNGTYATPHEADAVLAARPWGVTQLTYELATPEGLEAPARRPEVGR